jgi:hypothetical protein
MPLSGGGIGIGTGEHRAGVATTFVDRLCFFNHKSTRSSPLQLLEDALLSAATTVTS